MRTYLARMLNLDWRFRNVQPAISRVWRHVVIDWAEEREDLARRRIADVPSDDLRAALRERLAEHVRAWLPVRALLDSGDVEGARQAAATFEGPHYLDIRQALKAKLETSVKATRLE